MEFAGDSRSAWQPLFERLSLRAIVAVLRDFRMFLQPNMEILNHQNVDLEKKSEKKEYF